MLAVILVLSLLVAVAARGQEPFAEQNGEPYVITADRVELEVIGEQTVTHLVGNVVVTHGEAVLTGEEATAFEQQSLAVIRGNVRLIDQGVVFTGREGAYLRDERRAELTGDVVIVDRDKTITADRITYLRDTRVAEGYGNVCIVNSDRDVTVCGGEGTYDFAADHGTMEESPTIILSRGRPTVIDAERVELFDGDDIAIARGGVEVKREQVEAQCDELVYHSSEERALLRGDPVVVEGANWLKGNEIELIFADNALTEAHVMGRARCRHEVEGGGVNEVEGESITVTFENESATRMIVEGQARGVYRLPSEEEESGD
jgi:lipopolysaccharide export system protein LptA